MSNMSEITYVTVQWKGSWLTTNILDNNSNSNQNLKRSLKRRLEWACLHVENISERIPFFLTGQTHTNAKDNTYFSWFLQGFSSKLFIWIDTYESQIKGN